MSLNIFFSEITGLFEFKFYMEYSVNKHYRYDILRSLDQNDHHAHIWQNKITNTPKLTLTYFNIVKEVKLSASGPSDPLVSYFNCSSVFY